MFSYSLRPEILQESKHWVLFDFEVYGDLSDRNRCNIVRKFLLQKEVYVHNRDPIIKNAISTFIDCTTSRTTFEKWRTCEILGDMSVFYF